MVLVKIMSVHRLRVKHSTDLLVFDSTYRGREFHSEEGAYPESNIPRVQGNDASNNRLEGRSTTHTSITAIVHGSSSERRGGKLGSVIWLKVIRVNKKRPRDSRRNRH